LGFGAWVLGWDSRGAEVEMPGRAAEAMGAGHMVWRGLSLFVLCFLLRRCQLAYGDRDKWK
jgi:hypothetical protein